MLDMLVGYWPLWYPVAAAAVIAFASWFNRRYRRRLARARRSLVTERDAARAGRPSPAPIDVELMR